MPYDYEMVAPRNDPEFDGPRVGDHLERLFLNSGRGLVLAGVLAVFSTVGNMTPGDGATAFLGFSLLLFGVLLLTLSPLAHKIPRAAG